MNGYFLVDENENEEFDIKCELRHDVDGQVPKEQSLLYAEIETTCNVIKSLDSTSDDIKRKYFNKLLSLAQVGLVPETAAQPKMSLIALEKLKMEMLHIEGKRIKNQYMKKLGIIAIVLSISIGMITVIIPKIFEDTSLSIVAYTWLGAMIGAWISFGARKFKFKFEDLSVIEKDLLEPVLRLIYIGICSLVFQLFILCGIATITIGNITTQNIKNDVEIQILIGVLCGLVESKIGIDIYKKANSVLQFDVNDD